MKKICYLLILLLTFFSLAAYAAGSWDIDKLNTAKNSTDLTKLEKDIILELNKARSNPPQYANEYITELMNKCKKGKVKFNEGLPVVEECYKFLIKQEPMPLFYPETGLNLSAGLSLKETKTGNENSSATDKMELFGTRKGCWGELTRYVNTNAKDFVANLLINDGSPDRGMREILMDPYYTKIGIAISPGRNSLCVINVAVFYETNSKFKK